MNALYDRINDLCKAKGVAVSRMCLDLGLSKSIVSGLKTGRKKSLSAGTAQKIASYLDVSVGYLLGLEDNPPQKNTSHMNVAEKLPEILKDDELVEMFDAFYILDEKKRKIVLNLIRSLTEL